MLRVGVSGSSSAERPIVIFHVSRLGWPWGAVFFTLFGTIVFGFLKLWDLGLAGCLGFPGYERFRHRTFIRVREHTCQGWDLRDENRHRGRRV